MRMNNAVNEKFNENHQCAYMVEYSEEKTAEKAKTLIKALFGKDYDRFRKIFYHICISDVFDYKILVTRRAYLLYKIFVLVFRLFENERPDESKTFYVKGQVYNSHSIELINSFDIAKKRILVFDDIIVHGRTINSTIDRLKKLGAKTNQISVWCLLKSEYTNCLSSEIQERITTYRDCDEETWKNLSEDLTKIVVLYGKGYTSYVDTYVLKKSVFPILYKQLKTDKDFIELHSLERFDVSSFLLFPQPKEDGESKDYNCIRFYKYEDYLLIVPYVFIETIQEDCVRDYAFALLYKYEIKKAPADFFENGDLKKNLEKLFLKWTVNAIGKKIVESFLSKYNIVDSLEQTIIREESFQGINPQTTIDLPVQVSSFSKNYDESIDLDVDFCNKKLAESVSESLRFIRIENEEDVTELIQNAFSIYSFKIKEEDERRAKKQSNAELQERCKGLRITDAIYIFNDLLGQYCECKEINLSHIVRRETVALFIQNWDCGVASYDFSSFNDENTQKSMISGFIRNGEQVFREIYKSFNEIYQYYYVFTAKTLITDVSSLYAFGNYLENNLPERLRTQAKLFNEYMNLNSSYFADVFIVDSSGIRPEIFDFVNNYIRRSL